MVKAVFNLKKTYLAVIVNSLGSKLFKNVFIKKGNKNIDICQAGKFSCAVFVSYVLKIFGLITEAHATVNATIIDMEKSGWYKIKKVKQGAVLLWEAGDLSNNHQHIGFYYKNKKAISNISKRGFPQLHHWTYGAVKGRPKRKIISMYWHNKLDV